MASRTAALGCAALLGLCALVSLGTWAYFAWSAGAVYKAVTAGPVPPEEQDWFTAARKGDVVRLKAGLANGIDVDRHERHHGRTALMRATFFGHRAAVDLLIASKADPDAEDFEKATALDLAARAGEAEIVAVLARAGASVNRRKDPDDRTPLYGAVDEGRVHAARALLDAGADANLGNQDQSPLERAIDRADAAMVALLLSRGARPSPSGGQHGRDGLLLRVIDQCQDADPPILTALVKAGADPGATDSQGKTALYWARYFTTRADRRACSERQLAALTAAGVTR